MLNVVLGFLREQGILLILGLLVAGGIISQLLASGRYRRLRKGIQSLAGLLAPAEQETGRRAAREPNAQIRENETARQDGGRRERETADKRSAKAGRPDERRSMRQETRPGVRSGARTGEENSLRPEGREESRSGIRADGRKESRSSKRVDERTERQPGRRADERPAARSGARPEERAEARGGIRPEERPESRSGMRPEERAEARRVTRPEERMEIGGAAGPDEPMEKRDFSDSDEPIKFSSRFRDEEAEELQGGEGQPSQGAESDGRREAGGGMRTAGSSVRDEGPQLIAGIERRPERDIMDPEEMDSPLLYLRQSLDRIAAGRDQRLGEGRLHRKLTPVEEQIVRDILKEYLS